MYSLYNEGKSVIAEKLVKILMPKIYKKITTEMVNLILVIWIN